MMEGCGGQPMMEGCGEGQPMMEGTAHDGGVRGGQPMMEVRRHLIRGEAAYRKYGGSTSKKQEGMVVGLRVA